MKSRRSFIRKTSLLAGGLSLFSITSKSDVTTSKKTIKPRVISTWQHGMQANTEAWRILSQNGRSIDAVEKGVMVSESDPEVTSVGYGGAPDRDGKVTLDACIMNENGDCGAVAFLEHIKNPIAVARLVMEKTPHAMLAGDGALEFALEQGFSKENLLTEKAEIEWKNWLINSQYKPVINIENHDTIGMLAIDHEGNLSGACTTSGLGYKMHGRIGDSPIIGAGLYVDNEVGAACATGLGEAVIRQCGSFLIVELMRNGHSPENACKEAIRRIVKKEKDIKNLQVGFIAINKNGDIGSYSIHPGFDYALRDIKSNQMIKSDHYLK